MRTALPAAAPAPRAAFASANTARARAAAIVVGAALVLSGCGGPSAEEQARAKAAAEQRAEAARERREAQVEELAHRAATTREKACSDGLGKLVTQAGELSSRLNIGLDYSEYFDRVADLRVTYDASEFDDLELPCVQGVGLRLERALNEYAGAARSWQRCVDSYACDNDDNTRRLQTRWATADQQIGAAKDALNELGEVDDELREQAEEELTEGGGTTGDGTTPEGSFRSQ